MSYEDKIILLKKQEQQAMIPYDFDEPVSKVYYVNDRQPPARNVSFHAHLHIHQPEQHYEPMPTYYPDDYQYGIGVPAMVVVVFVGGFLVVVFMLIGMLAGG